MFLCYFKTYEEYRGQPHPPIRAEQIDRIMQDMPYLRRPDPEFIEFIKETFNRNLGTDIDPDMYPALILLHIRTKYRRCDYNINHFFSGKIRELRLYEMGGLV